MSEELVCPDCGGFIGLEPGDLRQACRCFTPAAKIAPPPAVALRPAIARLMAQSAHAGQNNAAPAADQTSADEPVKQSPAPIALDGDSGTASAEDSGAGMGPDASAGPLPEKACRTCGKDLAGHRRIKDSLGYLCRECAKAEAPPEDPDRRPCPECERKIKPGGFVPYNGAMICRRCFADHMELDKYKKAAPSAAGFVRQEKQKLGRLLALAGVLLVLMMWSAIKHFVWK